MTLTTDLVLGLQAQRAAEPRDPTVFAASSSGECPRMRTLRAQRVPPTETIGAEGLLVFAFGDAVEEVVAAALQAGGCVVSDRQREVTVPLPDGGVVVGHIDGLLAGNVLLEVKSIHEFGFKLLTEPKPEHVAQVTLYMAGLQAQGLNVTTAQLLYISKGASKGKDWGREFTVPFDAALLTTLLATWAEVYSYVHSHELPVRPAGYAQLKYPCTYCDWCTHCWSL